jgi:D-alanyl-D-alanine carboxypeptidase
VAARVLTAIVVASSAAARAGAQATTLEARLGAVLDDVIAAQRLPGATAAVSVDGRVVAVARGFADRERRIPMTPSHRMLVGSAGKPFFAFVAVSAAHERGIDLDTPVAQWLGAEPWFARLPNANRITLRHLLAHRSGIANHVADSGFVTVVRTATPTRRALGFTPLDQIAFVLDRPPPFGAGERFLYTDTGYLIAALALERILGHTYYEELAARVLRPLELDATSPSNRPDLAGLPQGYIRPPEAGAAAIGFATWGLPERMVSDGRLALNPVYEWTGGGLVSTTSDLARWMEALFERAPWKPVSDAMVAVQPPDAPYGLGIFVRRDSDGLLYFHPGGFPGYRTEVAYSPELGVGVAFQANESAPGGASVIPAILAAVRGGAR